MCEHMSMYECKRVFKSNCSMIGIFCVVQAHNFCVWTYFIEDNI
jgi:hypothetical protein